MDYAYLENGRTLTLDPKKCTACGQCQEVCPHGVFARSAQNRIEVTARDRCMECGACALNCPVQALSVRRGVGCAIAVYNGLKTGGPADCGCGSTPDGEGDSGCC